MVGLIGVPPRPLDKIPAARPLAAPDPEVVTTGPTADPSRTIGDRIARRFFELCEDPRTRDRVMRAVRSSADSAVGGRLLVALLSRTVFTPLLRSRRVDVAAVRLELVAAQLAGVAVLRYVTRMEPVASLPVDDLVAIVGPALQTTLDRPGRT